MKAQKYKYASGIKNPRHERNGDLYFLVPKPYRL